jgi:copper resistance protein C
VPLGELQENLRLGEGLPLTRCLSERLCAGVASLAQGGNTMRVGLKAAGPGTYHMHWHALSVDTHTTQGSFTFHVGGP